MGPSSALHQLKAARSSSSSLATARLSPYSPVSSSTGRRLTFRLQTILRGANIVCTVLFSLLENPLGKGVRLPKAIVLAYAALDFNFTCA